MLHITISKKIIPRENGLFCATVYVRYTIVMMKESNFEESKRGMERYLVAL